MSQSVPLNRKYLDDHGNRRAVKERLNKLLSVKPNGYMTPQELWELLVGCLCLRGNFYAYKVKALGEVVELLPLDPGSVIPKLGSNWDPETPVLFNGRSAAAKGYTVKGTVESWRESVAMLAQGNPSMMLGIACALAAPLIGVAGADGFGVHLFGGSSAGKTTTGNAASTVYGEPDVLKLTWYSTALGLVNEAAAHNDGFMPLDAGRGVTDALWLMRPMRCLTV